MICYYCSLSSFYMYSLYSSNMLCLQQIKNVQSPCVGFYIYYSTLSQYNEQLIIYKLIKISMRMSSGGHLIIKMPSYQYRDSHYKDKTVSWPSYLYNGDSYTQHTVFIRDPGGHCWGYYPGTLSSTPHLKSCPQQALADEMTWLGHQDSNHGDGH